MITKKKRPADIAAHNVREWLRDKNWSQEALANASGVSGKTINNVLYPGRSTSTAQASTYERLAKALGRSYDDLFIDHNVRETPREGHDVPVIDYVQAGNWTEISDAYPAGEGMKTITVTEEYGDGTFALEISGESMLPEFREGDVVVVDPSITDPLPGDYVVARLNGDEQATFKKYRQRRINTDAPAIELVPLNEDYPVLVMDNDHPGEIVGVMVEHRKFRKRRRR